MERKNIYYTLFASRELMYKEVKNLQEKIQESQKLLESETNTMEKESIINKTISYKDLKRSYKKHINNIEWLLSKFSSNEFKIE